MMNICALDGQRLGNARSFFQREDSLNSVDENALGNALDNIVPGAALERVRLPQCPAIELLLMQSDYPQGELAAEDVQRAMDNPLYWVFCWASGQVLAEQLLANPAWVAGRRVVDFGCGSGVVAIAAAMAGAAEVIACDNDPLALSATAVNATLNGVELVLADDFAAVAGPVDLILVADVLYDRANLPWLDRFVARGDRVLVADSRVRQFDHPPYREVGIYTSCTLPDLDESSEFRYVKLYLAGDL